MSSSSGVEVQYSCHEYKHRDRLIWSSDVHIACIEEFQFTSPLNDSHFIVSRFILIHAHPHPLLQEGRGDVIVKSEDILI